MASAKNIYPICDKEAYAAKYFKSSCIIAVNAPYIIFIESKNINIFENSTNVTLKIVIRIFIKPITPIFISIPANIIDPAVGAVP